MSATGKEIVTILLFAHFYFIGYIFVFRHDIFRRIEKQYKEIIPLVRHKSLVHNRIFMANGIISIRIAFVFLHLFLVDASNGSCGIFTDIPTTCAVIIFTITGTVSIFNPEKMLRLYVYTNTWIRKHVVKLSPPPPIPEEVYKKQMFNIRITGIAWLIAALTWSCILY